MARRIPVAFDVLGTCYSLDAAVTAIVTAFGAETLAARNVNPALVVEDWFHTSQRDFTYLSMNDTYFPIFKVFSANLPRILSIAGLAPPVSATVDSKSLPCAVSTFSPEFLAPILTTLTAMTPRPSLSGCSALLSATSKFRLLAATNGGAASTRGLYINALGPEIGGEGPKGQWGVFSCDTAQVAKPAPAVYENIWTRFETDAAAAGEANAPREGWFVASHTWDLHAAKLAGFKTAWVSYEEHITCEEIYGRPDIVAADLEEAARRIIEWEQKAGTI